MEDWFDDVVCTGETKANVCNAIQTEIERYQNYVISEAEQNMTVLEWWKLNEAFFPRIARIAKKLLAVPASSVPSERVFSLAGALVSKKRARMSDDNVDLLIFLNKNMKQYW
jgi:hypothetical protein